MMNKHLRSTHHKEGEASEGQYDNKDESHCPRETNYNIESKRSRGPRLEYM